MSEHGTVYIVVRGVPQEHESLTQAEEHAAALVEFNGLVHATVLAVPKNWQEMSLVAENRGVVISTIEELTRPFDTDEEDR